MRFSEQKMHVPFISKKKKSLNCPPLVNYTLTETLLPTSPLTIEISFWTNDNVSLFPKTPRNVSIYQAIHFLFWSHSIFYYYWNFVTFKIQHEIQYSRVLHLKETVLVNFCQYLSTYNSGSNSLYNSKNQMSTEFIWL